MNIEMDLKSRSYIIDLDRFKLSLRNFFSELFNGESFVPAFRIFLYFCQKHTPKSRKFYVFPNFTCGKRLQMVQCNVLTDSWRFLPSI